MPYKIVDTVNGAVGVLTDTYRTYHFLRNPVFTAIIVTFITISIYLYLQDKDTKIIFFTAVLINTVYMFMYQTAMKKFYTTSKEAAVQEEVVAQLT